MHYNLNRLKLFHVDRGNEFKNKSIEQAHEAFSIKSSLSPKGKLYDYTALAESTFKTLKTEFNLGEYFDP